jgi:hypothetical protein
VGADRVRADSDAGRVGQLRRSRGQSFDTRGRASRARRRAERLRPAAVDPQARHPRALAVRRP